MAIAINPISIFVSIFLVLVFVFLCAASGEIKMFIMHQYAPFQMTKIGGLGRDVNHACQLPHGCLDPLMSITGHIDNIFCDAHIGVDNNIGVTIFCGCLKTAGHYATP